MANPDASGEVEIHSLSECEDEVHDELESDIESEYEPDPLVASSGEPIADIGKDMAHKLFLLSNALYTEEGETLVDVMSDIRTALKNLNKILFNKLGTSGK